MGILWLEARDAAECPNDEQNSPHSRSTHRPNVSAAKFEKLCYIKKQNMLQISFLSHEIIELTGLRTEEQNIINDIVFIMKEMLNEDKTRNSYTMLNYFYHFLQAANKTKEVKYILGYISKSAGFTPPTVYEFEEDQQFIFESIMYSAMTLYNNGGASKTKLNESHRRWENELSKKNEEKLSRTQELNTAKVLALKELGYTEINEHNASEVFDKIAEIQSRGIY